MASEPSEWAMRKAKVLDEVGCGVCDDHSQVQDPDNPEEGALINDPTGCTWAFSCARLRAVATVLDSARTEADAAGYDRGKAEGVREEMEHEAAKSCETCGRNTGPETGLCPSSKCPRCRRNDPMEDYWISRTEAAIPPKPQGDGKGGG